jgi:hypothetical protein
MVTDVQFPLIYHTSPGHVRTCNCTVKKTCVRLLARTRTLACAVHSGLPRRFQAGWLPLSKKLCSFSPVLLVSFTCLCHVYWWRREVVLFSKGDGAVGQNLHFSNYILCAIRSRVKVSLLFKGNFQCPPRCLADFHGTLAIHAYVASFVK